MKILQLILVVTAVALTVAFPTPQEVKPSPEIKKPDELVPMVQKIEIHVEVKAVPSDMEVPAMVTVTEFKEHLEKSTEAAKSIDAEKAAELAGPADVKSSESVESLEDLKAVEATTPVKPVEPFVVAAEAEAPKVDDITLKATDIQNAEIVDAAPVKVDEVQPVKKLASEEVDQKVESTSQSEVAVVNALAETSLRADTEPVEAATKAENPAQVVAKVINAVKSQTKDDSDEDNSSEETKTMMKSPEESAKNIDAAIEQTPKESAKEEQLTTTKSEAQTDELEKNAKVVVSVIPNPEAKSIMSEKIVPIVEDLPMEKQSVEAEPVYRTIPVAVVHDEPIKEDIKEVTLKAADPVEMMEHRQEESSVVKSKEVITVNADVMKPTAQDEVESTTVGEFQNQEAPSVKTVDTVTTVDAVQSAAPLAEVEKVTSENLEEPKALVVEAIKALGEKESQQTVAATAESTKEIEVKTIAAAEQQGSSTKAESEKTEQQVEDSSVSSSANTELRENLPKASEVAEKAEEQMTEASTTTTTTTTTAAPVKVEGKKGKKKLPGSNIKQNAI